MHSRYHPDYFLKQEITSDSGKSYPVTGATGFHYSHIAFHKTDSGARSYSPYAPVFTNHRLSDALEKYEFSLTVFTIYTYDI